MKRRVDLLVSPKWIAQFFKCELGEGAIWFDREAPGDTPGGQIRIPVDVEIDDESIEIIEGVITWAEIVPCHPATLPLVKRHILEKAEKVTLPIQSGWRPRKVEVT